MNTISQETISMLNNQIVCSMPEANQSNSNPCILNHGEESNESLNNVVTQPQHNSITFSFSNGQSISYEISILMDISPSIFAKLQIPSSKEISLHISLPSFISFQNLNDFICLVKNNCMMIDESNSKTQELINVLKTSEYFRNDIYSSKIINDLVIQVLSVDNVMQYFNFCYEKIKAMNKKGIKVDQSWYTLIYKCLDMIENNFFSEKKFMDSILDFDSKIIEEICKKLIYKYMIGEIEINSSQKQKIIEIFMKLRNQTSYFMAIINENYLCKNEKIFAKLDPNTEFRPALKIEIGKHEINYLYKEIEVILDGFSSKIIFVFYYDNKKDSLDISIKIAKNPIPKKKEKPLFFPIFSLSSNINIKTKGVKDDDEILYENNSQIFLQNYQKAKNPLTQIASIKNFLKKNVLKLNKFEKQNSFIVSSLIPHQANISSTGEIQSKNISDSSTLCDNESIIFNIFLKINYLQSFIMSNMVENFQEIFHDKSVFRIEYEMLFSILTHEQINKKCEDEIIITLINWLENETNSKHNINDIFQVIQWGKVSYELIFEIIIKYNNFSSDSKEKIINEIHEQGFTEGVMKYFINSFISKYFLIFRRQ